MRRQAVGGYLAARRRELWPRAGPTLRVYSAPGRRAAIHYVYQSYTAAGGQPYTYQQHSRNHYSPAEVPVESNHPVARLSRSAGQARGRVRPTLRRGPEPMIMSSAADDRAGQFNLIKTIFM